MKRGQTISFCTHQSTFFHCFVCCLYQFLWSFLHNKHSVIHNLPVFLQHFKINLLQDTCLILKKIVSFCWGKMEKSKMHVYLPILKTNTIIPQGDITDSKLVGIREIGGSYALKCCLSSSGDKWLSLAKCLAMNTRSSCLSCSSWKVRSVMLL